MSKKTEVKPYLSRVKNWKIRNIVMLYLEAREEFRNYRRSSRRGDFLSFDKLREICEILFEIKEEHHLVYKRLIDPQKNKFEKGHKIMPDKIETEFMNNIGLLFHKVMAARESRYVMEHYVEKSDTFQKNEESLQGHLEKIDELFEEGIDVLSSLIQANKDNILLLTLLLEDPKRTKRHFGKNAEGIIEQFGNNEGLAGVYFNVGQYYSASGWPEKAKRMFESALKENADHKNALAGLANLN
jgi:tetratricopeptide (TPR) repeat protein